MQSRHSCKIQIQDGMDMEILKKGKAAMLVVVMIVIGIFLAGRYGWKLGGFRACQSAGISSVTAE